MKKYNLSKIMTNAWEIQRLRKSHRINLPFADALILAWKRAKEAVNAALEAEKQAEISRLEYEARAAVLELAAKDPRVIAIDKELFTLQMKDRWDNADRDLNNKLSSQRSALVSEIRVTKASEAKVAA